MNILQQGIIALVRSALTQTPQVLPDGFCMEDAMSVIYDHNIQALCYDGAILCGIPNKGCAMENLFRTYCSTVIAVTKQDRAINRILSAFEENGIDYMPLKGSIMRSLYPKPELRTMGDADIPIRMEQYDRIVPIMEELGYAFCHATDHDYLWKTKDLNVELHYQLLPESRSAYSTVFADGWSVAERAEGYRWRQQIEDEWIFNFCHFTKHYTTGVGIRHVADLWVFLKHHPQMDFDYVIQKLSELNLAEFYENAMQLVSCWFAGAAATEKSDYMTDYIFGSGSFGDMETHRLNAFADEVSGRTLYGNTAYKLRRFFIAIFPSREKLGAKFPFVVRHPWLYLPMVLIYPFYRITQERSLIKNWTHTISSYDSDLVGQKIQQLEYVGIRTKR